MAEARWSGAAPSLLLPWGLSEFLTEFWPLSPSSFCRTSPVELVGPLPEPAACCRVDSRARFFGKKSLFVPQNKPRRPISPNIPSPASRMVALASKSPLTSALFDSAAGQWSQRDPTSAIPFSSVLVRFHPFSASRVTSSGLSSPPTALWRPSCPKCSIRSQLHSAFGQMSRLRIKAGGPQVQGCFLLKFWRLNLSGLSSQALRRLGSERVKMTEASLR